MMYLNPIQNENGSYSNLQSSPAVGLVAFPNEFLSEFFKEGKECAGFVNIEHDGQKVINCTWDETAYETYVASLPIVNLTSAEKREEAYNTEAIIEWDGEMITITQAAQLWYYYAAEGSDKAAELTALISEAKEKVREEHPDE